MRKPRKVTLKHARTTRWCLYKSPITPHSPLLQSTLDGRQRDRCSRSSHVQDEKMQFTYCTPDISASTATIRRPEKAPRNIHSTSALSTAHLSLKTSAQGAQKRLSTSVPACRRGATVVPHFHSPQRFSESQWRILPVRVPQFLANRVRNYDLRRARLVIERVASHVSLRRLLSSAATWPCCFRLDDGR